MEQVLHRSPYLFLRQFLQIRLPSFQSSDIFMVYNQGAITVTDLLLYIHDPSVEGNSNTTLTLKTLKLPSDKNTSKNSKTNYNLDKCLYRES